MEEGEEEEREGDRERARERVWTELDWSGRSAVKGGREWAGTGGVESRAEREEEAAEGEEEERRRERRQEDEEEGRRDCLPDCLMLTVQPEKGLSVTTTTRLPYILQSVHASLSAYRLQVTYRYTFSRSKVPMPTSLRCRPDWPAAGSVCVWTLSPSSALI